MTNRNTHKPPSIWINGRLGEREHLCGVFLLFGMQKIIHHLKICSWDEIYFDALYYASPYVMPFIAKWYLIESESLRVFELSLKIKSFGLRLTQHCLLVNFFLLNSWKMSFFKDVVHIYLNNSSLWLLNAETWFFARLYYCIIFYFGELFIEEPKQSHTHRL